ncbi:unnamed protein product [Didymodactylos carnosus]|uniref:Protein farnesyltransferase subunit beta n=1 Tax=Didymodactylos carnosus TaxID=1234261 RepID=A0A8S2EXC0_9BILA|nr:unnamed protein product [Didymodactylos carnosus]CAF4133686.1 unnamed protein product [Didymodactylos carnosus]
MIKCEESVEKIYKDFLSYQHREQGSITLYREHHVRYLLKALRSLPQVQQSLDASRPWLIYWIIQSLYLLNEKLSDAYVNEICDFLQRCQNPEGGVGGPGQIPHLAPTYAAVNALCILQSDRAYDVINREKLASWLRELRSSNGSFSLHIDGESDIRCQTYEGGFGAVPGCEAHGGYTFCGYATLLLLQRENLCDKDNLLRWTVNRQMEFEGGFQGRTNKLVDGCYSFWVGALFPLLDAAERKLEHTIVRDERMFDSVAAQEYVLLCSQSNLSGGFTDRPKANSHSSDLYHTCYCLSGLSLFQHSFNKNIICGNIENAVCETHPLFNIGPECAYDAMQHYKQLDASSSNQNESVNDN